MKKSYKIESAAHDILYYSNLGWNYRQIQTKINYIYNSYFSISKIEYILKLNIDYESI